MGVKIFSQFSVGDHEFAKRNITLKVTRRSDLSIGPEIPTERNTDVLWRNNAIFVADVGRNVILHEP